MTNNTTLPSRSESGSRNYFASDKQADLRRIESNPSSIVSSSSSIARRFTRKEQVLDMICDSRDGTEYSWVGASFPDCLATTKGATAEHSLCYMFPARCRPSRNQLYVEPDPASGPYILPSGERCTGMIITIVDDDHERADKFVRHRARYGTQARVKRTAGVFFDNGTSLRFRNNAWPTIDLMDDTFAWVEQDSLPCTFFCPARTSSWSILTRRPSILSRQSSNTPSQGVYNAVESFEVGVTVEDDVRRKIRSARPGEEYTFDISITWPASSPSEAKDYFSISEPVSTHTISVVKKGDVFLTLGRAQACCNIIQPVATASRKVLPKEKGRWGQVRTGSARLTCYQEV